MDPQLKQRIVGAAVLFALAIIFIPPFLQQGEPPPSLPQRDVAPLPATPTPPAAVPVDPTVVAEVEAGIRASSEELGQQLGELPADEDLSEPAAAPSAAKPLATVTAVTPAAVQTTAMAGRWRLQLGSFVTRQNADKLRAKLETAGFKASISPLDKGGKQSYRVRVGEAGTRAEVTALHKRLTAQTGYAGILVREEAP